MVLNIQLWFKAYQIWFLETKFDSNTKGGRFMTVSDIIDGIITKKNAIGMTNQQLADASGVPKTTIDRILRKETSNPTMQTVLDLAAAVGYSFSNHPEQDPVTPTEMGIKDPMVLHLIQVYENRGKAYEERIKRTTSHFNMLLQEKNRWIKFSLLLNIILVVFICGILIYDLTHLDRGWIQQMMAGRATGMFNNILMSFRTFVR